MSHALVVPETNTNIAMGSWPESSPQANSPNQFRTGRLSRLPTIYPITPNGPLDAPWWKHFNSGLSRGYTLVQLRIRNEPEAGKRATVELAAASCREVGCVLMLNSAVTDGERRNTSGISKALQWVEEFDLAGIHLPALTLLNLSCNPFAGQHDTQRRYLSASCHTPEELRQAERIGADWVCLSPVRPTASHPGAPVLGMDTFREWTAACHLPVFGLGGLGPGDVDLIRAAGGQGVAGISAFWG